MFYQVQIKPSSSSSCNEPIVCFRKDPLFTEENIRSYFGGYGTIDHLRMLEEDENAGVCLLTFADPDCSDCVLLDLPHHLNGQSLSIHKYATSEYVCSLSQFRFIDRNDAYRIKRWHPIFRNLTDFIQPLGILQKTQLALLRDEIKKQISTDEKNLNQTEEEMKNLEKKSSCLKEDYLQLYQRNEKLHQQIDETIGKTSQIKETYAEQLKEQQKKNQLLKSAIKNLAGKTSAS